MIQKGYFYNDISLIPKFSEVESRSHCDTSVILGGRKFDLPVIPANMTCVIDNELAAELQYCNIFHIAHRFNDSYLSYLRYANKVYNDTRWNISWHKPYASISIGIKQSDYDLIDCLWGCSIQKTVPIEYITIDVAHGHHQGVINMIRYIKKLKWPYKTPFVIAGNVATAQAVKNLEDAGADATKVGVGDGLACTTYKATGVLSPMFSTIQECASVANKPIIADGGIREIGDISKAIVAGATMVMIGSLFTACIDSPAETIYPKNWYNFKQFISKKKNYEYKKVYYGSASQYNKSNNKHIEGTLIELKGNKLTYKQQFQKIKEGLQSNISYMGGKDLSILNMANYQLI